MPSHVQVILKEEVESLGGVGELVRVRPGYARNYLLPRGLAVLATRGSIEQIEHERKAALQRAQKLKKQATGIAAAMAEVSLVLAKKAGEEGKLFGSVTAAEVADLLHSKGYEVDRRKLVMPDEPIKHLGTHEISAKLDGGVVAGFKLEVVAEEE